MPMMSRRRHSHALHETRDELLEAGLSPVNCPNCGGTR